jgi:hypothetical protein
LIDVGPEQSEKLIATAATIACCGEHSKHRQPATLVSMITDYRRITDAGNAKRPERAKLEPRDCRPSLRGRNHAPNLGHRRVVIKKDNSDGSLSGV